MSLIKQAVDELYMRCDGAHALDGAGFSLYDKQFGHYLASKDFDDWSDNQKYQAWKMLRKYKKQLSNYGIDYDSIPEQSKPVYEAKTVEKKDAQAGRRIQYDPKDGTFIVNFRWPQDKFLKDVVKQGFQGRVYDPVHKTWVATLNTHNARFAADLIAEYAFEADDDTIKMIESRSGGATRTIEKAGANLLLSFPFSYAIYKELKKIPTLKKNKQSYSITPDAESASKVLALVSAFDFTITDEALEYIEQLVRDAIKNIEQSRAEEGELDLPDYILGTPRPYQVAGINYALRNKKVIIGDECGLGKTVQALLTVAMHGSKKILIGCPASVKLNWAKEVYNWFGEKWTPTVIEGRKRKKRGDHTVLTWHGKKRVPINNSRCKFVICNYSVLPAYIKDYPDSFDAVIFDESHYLKNEKAQRTKAALRIAKKVDVALLLTGTAIKNRPIELVQQLKITDNLKKFGGAYDFKLRYCNPKYNGYGYDFKGASNLEELNRKLRASGFIRRMAKDVLPELPDVQKTIVPLEIDNVSEYKRADRDPIQYIYEEALNDKELWNEVIAMLRDNGIHTTPQDLIETLATEKANRASRAEHLVRICVLRRVAAKGKMNSVVTWINDFIDDNDEKVVVFAVHRDVQHRLLQEFPDAAHVLGSDSSVVRQEQVDSFQDGDKKVIICSLYAASEGINLQSASNVVFVQEGWTPAERIQAIGRVKRYGQESNSVNAWFLEASDTIEIDIAELINRKEDHMNKTLDGDLVAEEDYVSTLTQLIEEINGEKKESTP